MPEVAPSLDEGSLERWLDSRGLQVEHIFAMAGDVSRRRYWRLRLASGSTVVAVGYPQDIRSVCDRFAATSSLLEQAGVRVPGILDADCHGGFMILEDLGDATLYDLPLTDPRRHERLMREAVTISARISRLPSAAVAPLSSPLDRSLLEEELEFAWTNALERPELSGNRDLQSELQDCLGSLIETLSGEPLLPCHRDFMIRNLMPTANGRLAVIDHQDLRLGPRFYDLASLLNDSFFPPPALELELRRPLVKTQRDIEHYRRCAVQRCLKAVGTFVAFAARGSRRHLRLVPPTLSRAAHHLAKLPEGAGLAAAISKRWSKSAVSRLRWPSQEQW